MRNFPLRLGQRVLLLHQVLLQLVTRVKSTVPAFVLNLGDLDGLLGVVHAFGLELRPLLGFQEGHQAVLHILIGVQDRVLIGGHQLLEPGILEAHVIQDAAVVEDVPLKRRADGAVEGREWNRSLN